MEEANDTSYSLKFLVHHKTRNKEATTCANTSNISFVTTEEIEKTIIKAYRKAEVIMDGLQLTKILKENDLNDFQKLNGFVFRQLTEKSTVDYSCFNEDDLYDSSDADNTNVELTDELLEANSEVDENCLDEYNPDDCHLITSKDTFHGMRIFDKINLAKKSHYFQIKINNNSKFIHKQTAARLLTFNKNSLPSDRLSRVQATSKQQ